MTSGEEATGQHGPANSGRAALVTGASRGIGRAIAEVLGATGFRLTITARQPKQLEETADQLRSNGYIVESVAADVAEEEALQNVAARHQARFGRLDVLVNNAGIATLAGVDEQTTDYIDRMLAVNLRPMMILSRECVAMLRAAGAEHRNALVVNVASVSGKTGEAWLSCYSATKAGMIGFTEAMNEELNTFGVKSVALCPGYVDTDMSAWAKQSGECKAEDMLRPRDVAEAVRFLLTLSASCAVPEIVLRRPLQQPGK
jgi:NAD(P)-dependent dehydrogenase (short-subunit alcohol dehydrogenase family)